jgi:AraC-like DNA-binding protein
VERLPGMIEVRRSVRLPEHGASRHYVGLQRPGLRVYVIATDRVIVDTAVLGASVPRLMTMLPTIGNVTFPLVGTYITRDTREEEHHVGRLRVDAPGHFAERWEGPRFRALCAEWAHPFGPPGAPTALALSPTEHAAIERVAEAIVLGVCEPAHLRTLFALLAAHRVLHRDALPDLDAPAPPHAHAIAGALNEIMVDLPSHPDLGDLEARVGLTSRHLRRRFAELGQWTPLHDGSFRATLRRHRVLFASSLASVPGATVEQIARALGYRAPQALLAALREEGLPSPAEARARALGHAL